MLPSIEELDSIVIFSRHMGLPAYDLSCLEINKETAELFKSFDMMNQTTLSVPTTTIKNLFTELVVPCNQPDAELFGKSQETTDFHFESLWTDDMPRVRASLYFNGVCLLELQSGSQNAYLLPWKVTNTTDEWTTFNPRISVYLGLLMPDGFLLKGRLMGVFDPFRMTSRHHKRQEARKLLLPKSKATSKSRTPVPKVRVYTTRDLPNLSESQLIELASNGYDLSCRDEWGFTALMIAATWNKSTEQFQRLLRAGANINAQLEDGTSGLMLACKQGQEHIVHEWLSAGADIHLRDSSHCTALMLAARRYFSDSVERMLKLGANVCDFDSNGNTAIDYLLEGPHPSSADKLFQSLTQLADEAALCSPDLLKRSYTRAIEVARKARLVQSIENFCYQSNLSKSRDQNLTRFTSEGTSLPTAEPSSNCPAPDVTEIELADRIVEIIRNKLEQHKIDY